MNALDTIRLVAQHIPRWAAAPSRYGHDDRICELTHPSGARVHVRLDSARFHFTGCGPAMSDGTYLHSTHSLVEILCRANRAPEALARELCTRLLPEYLEKLVAVRAEVDGWNRRGETARLIAERLGTVDRGFRKDDNPIAEVHVRTELEGVWRCRVSPGSADSEPSVSFEARLSPELAAEVFAVIREHGKK